MKAQEEPGKVGPGPAEGRRLRQLDDAVVRDTRGFASLRAEWDDLYRSCPSATPFSSWEWLYSWWEAYGEGRYALRLVALRNESGLLVGLLPLMARRGRLLLIGGLSTDSYDGMTHYKDVLIREGWEQAVAEAGAHALKELDGWRVADLQELMPHSAAWTIFREWQGPKTHVPIVGYVIIRAGSWEELLPSLSRNLRSIARRTLRHAEQDGVICEPAAPEDAERAARTLVRLHRELWRGRRIDPEDLTPRYEEFMRAAARRMTERGIGRVSEFRRQEDGEVLVSQFLLFDKDFVGVYVVGASKEATGRYQFMTLCNWDATNLARRMNTSYVSWMFYISQDKMRWASEVVRSHRLILSRTKTFWGPYAGYYLARDRYYRLLASAQVYVHSKEAPRWINSATKKYYELVLYPYSEDAPPWVKNATDKYYALRGRYGYGWLRYRLELARVRRQVHKPSHDT